VSFKKPKAPKEDPAATRARQLQIEQLADLNEEENRRIKNIFSATRGVRAFRGLTPRAGSANTRSTRLFQPRGAQSLLDGGMAPLGPSGTPFKLRRNT
jgi:hypothetical protein